MFKVLYYLGFTKDGEEKCFVCENEQHIKKVLRRPFKKFVD